VSDTDPVAALAADLRAAARERNERRLLVLAGEREAGLAAAGRALDSAGVDDAVLVTGRQKRPPGLRGAERVPPERTGDLLGTTREAAVLDAHGAFSPNALGRLAGAVDGGGLFVLVCPPLSAWPDRRDAFDERLAAPPFGVDDVAGNFRHRLVSTFDHPGVAVVDVDAGTVERDGAAAGASPPPASAPTVPPDAAFPAAAYRACLTGDQARAVRALEALRSPGSAVVVEADRGRGKTSAGGIAAACLAGEGRDVLFTAPGEASASVAFDRAAETLAALDALAADDRESMVVASDAGGHVRFAEPAAAVDSLDAPEAPDAVLVDEAAALPVRRLERFLDAPAVAFLTTVHGYEGAGRGFSVRFRDRLDASDRAVTAVTLEEPVRYARGDPVESWSFRALLLDARPAVDPAVADATLSAASYRELTPERLLADEHLLREAFGLLVLAHYRTEPDDLTRLLDAPNLSVRALTVDGHVVSVALLAREGGLDRATREAVYGGERVRGNMLPDVLTSQLRDPEGAAPVGWRVVRVATHHAVRASGFGSRLLGEVLAEAAGDRGGPGALDWVGAGFGATPRLVRFWADNGFRTVHLSTTRNDASGEYSALVVRPLTDAGASLAARHGRRFAERAGGVLGGPLSDLDPDVARAALAATDATVEPSLSAGAWRVVVGAAYGPGIADVDPDAFRRLAVAFLLGGSPLAAREERLLVRTALQGWRWTDAAEDLGYVSRGACMRAFGEAMRPVVDALGGEVARAERARYSGGEH
jgi:tRNA(Met) cytidine acetyltransferase